MAREKTSTTFFCRGCGYESPKWMGFCPACGDRVPLVEAPKTLRSSSSVGSSVRPSKPPTAPQELSQISLEEDQRISLGFEDLNRVLGGGLVAGSLVLMAGEPGIGKSTLLLQAAGYVAERGAGVLYISGEESAHQIKLRAERLGLAGQGVYLVSETDVDEIVQHLDTFRPTLAIVDSVQTLYSSEVPSGPGSVSQVRECGLQLMAWAKASSIPIILAGHVTKDGNLAGPRILEHMVDVVLYMEGENLNTYRILRGVKNRFGSTNEVGMFEMEEDGLREVLDASRVLISERRDGAVGSAVVPILEGNRPLMVEIQALTSPSILSVPRRVGNGVDYNRLLMLVAVLSRRAGLQIFNQDIIVNVVGGLKVHEPAADAAVCLAIASSFRNTPLPSSLASVGEVGLSGELRRIPQIERRLDEASRLGFDRCLMPAGSKEIPNHSSGISLVPAGTVAEAIRRSLPSGQITREKRSQEHLGDESTQRS